MPHTVEEAYELAAAAHAGDDAKLLDELGDVLFQVHFLALLLEERGAGSLAEVAEHCRQKLIRRHPHVFGDVEAESAGEVLRNWDAIKRDEPGARAGAVRRGAGEPPGPAVRAQGPAPRGLERLRLRPRALRRRRGGARGAARGRGRPRGGLPRGRRRPLRGGQRRPQAQGRSRARAARRGRALPRPRGGGGRPRRTRRRGLERSRSPTPSWATTPRRAWPRPKETPSREPDRDRPCPPDPRLRGNPTVEVDVALRSGAQGARRCPRAPRPASSRRPSCATAATPGWARASPRGGQRQRRDRRGGPRPRRARPERPRPRADRARRDAQQGAASAPTRSSASRSPRRGRPPRRSACRCGATWAATRRGSCPCRCSTSSTAASTPTTRWTSRSS